MFILVSKPDATLFHIYTFKIRKTHLYLNFNTNLSWINNEKYFAFLTVGQKVYIYLKDRKGLLKEHTALNHPNSKADIFFTFISNTTERKCKILVILYLVALSTISSDSALWFVFSSIAQFLDLRVSKRSFSKLPGSILGNCLISPKRGKNT